MKPLACILGLITGVCAQAQNWQAQPQTLISGLQHNLGPEPQAAFVGLLSATNAVRVRVHIAAATLSRSRMRFTAIQDGQSQTLDASALDLWSRTSAMFNGGEVRLELLLTPGDRGVSVDVDYLLADLGGAVSDPGYRPPGLRALCGADDRVASTDNRVGRINGVGGCTGWLVANGAVLTAGHCGIAAGSIFEVNIPASLADGTIFVTAVQDQFPVLAGSITAASNGLGDDWTVCRVGPNNLGQSAHVLHGFFRMTREVPASGQTIRITGCGIDNSPLGSQPTVCGHWDAMRNCTHFGLNAQNKTLQTSTGSFAGGGGSEPRLALSFAVDMEPANSGSPIIWEAIDFAIGIATHGGCTSSGGANYGTSFELNALENAIATSPGPNTRYLDTVKAPSGTEDGTVFQPHDTLAEAVLAVPWGGTVSVVAGAYTGAANRGTFTKPMTLVAPVGTVTLGR